MYVADSGDGPNNGTTQVIYCDGVTVANRTYSRQYSALDSGWRGGHEREHCAAIAAQAGRQVAGWAEAYQALRQD